MRKQLGEIQSVETIARDTVQLVFKNEWIASQATPGQFLHITAEGHTLRRPISIADVDKNRVEITILFKVIGTGTEAIATYQPGMMLDVLGPLGNGFPEGAERSVLLIGGGIGVPPLYYLGKKLYQSGVKVTSILGFQTKASVFYEEEFKALGTTYIVTDDGSYGTRGLVTDVISQVRSFEKYYTCGPVPMLRAVQQTITEQPGYISLEERMGCGIGACYACVIPAHNDDEYAKVCKDGPVFVSSEVIL